MFQGLLHWLLAAVCILVTANVVPGFKVDNLWAALLAALILGLLNILVWPVLFVLTIPLTILTFGVFLLVLNAIVLKFGASLVPGFQIVGFAPAFWGAIVLTIVGWLVRFAIYPPAQ